MAHSNITPSTLLKKAKVLASSTRLVSEVKRENKSQSVRYWLGLIIIIGVVLVSAYSVFSTYNMIHLVTNKWWLALTVLPIEYIVIAVVIAALLIYYNATWWNFKRAISSIVFVILAIVLPLTFANKIQDNWVVYPSKDYLQSRLIASLQEENADIGTIVYATLIPDTNDYLVLVANAKSKSEYIMPQPPFVPKGGEKLWLKYAYTGTIPKITTMGLIN